MNLSNVSILTFTMVLRPLFLTLTFLTLNSLALKNISISKCCPHDQKISESSANEYVCVETDEKNWLPKIYSLKKRNFSDIPKTWIIKSKFLECNGTIKSYKQNVKVPTQVLLSNGSLMIFGSGSTPPERYCVDYQYALVCESLPAQELTQPKTKIKKCCGKSAVWSELKKSCVVMNVVDYKIDIGDDKILVEGFPGCNDHVLIGKLHEANMSSNGSLQYYKEEPPIPVDGYCLEHVLENSTGSPTIFSCHEYLPTTTSVPIDNLSDVSVDRFDLRLKFYPAGLLLSAVFLAATLAAGTVLPASHHHQLHWKCQTNHIACLMIGDVLLGITQLVGTSFATAICNTTAILMHFLFLAAFFWLNTMCFNIWWTFRDLRPASMEKRQEQWRLRLYAIYAWGIPLIIALIALILDQFPDSPDYEFLKPNFGKASCWFPGNLEILAYFYGPVGALLIINLLLFAATARELTCGLWKRELVKSTTERAALGRVCMKLVVVMGVVWIADVLSWAVGGPQALWYITDVINSLHGVFIFIVVACQPQVWTAIKRLWCRRQSLANDITGNGNHHSSSSHAPPSYGESVASNVTNVTRTIPLETNC